MWSNSTLIESDATEAVARPTEQPGKDISSLGCNESVRSPIRRRLVRWHAPLIQWLVRGPGRRLLQDGGPFAAPPLAGTKTTTGVLVATYQTAGPAAEEAGSQ